MNPKVREAQTIAELFAQPGVARPTPARNFQRRHYLVLAGIIKGLVAESDLSLDNLIDVVSALSEVLTLDNWRFEERKFVESCGISWCLYTGEFFKKE